MAFNPSAPPVDENGLLQYLQEEFNRVSESYNPLIEGQYEVLYKLPNKFKPGMVCYFAGSASPLGTGIEGLYRYSTAGTWIYVG